MNQPPGALSLPSQSWLPPPPHPQPTPCSPGPETSGGPTGGESCFPKEGRKESKHHLILYRLLLLLPSPFGTAFFPANPPPPCPPQPGRGYLWCHCIEMGGLEESCRGLRFTCSVDAVTEPLHPEDCSAFPSYWLGPFSLEVGDVAQRDTCPSVGLLGSQNNYSHAVTPPECLYSWGR